MINPHIFREYDIRGVVGKDLTPDSVRTLGKGFGTYAVGKGIRTVMLGRDCRLSSPEFRDAMAEGLSSTGLFVVDVGICPSPLLYFSILQFGADGGVMITGSHNPPDFNGFKLCIGPSSLYGEKIQEVRRIVERGEFASGTGRVTSRTVIPEYQRYIKSILSIPRRLKVVVDAGNGTASTVAPELFRDMGVEVVELFCEMDGRFPNHFPDPTVPENLRFLIEAVREHRADVGGAGDGQADHVEGRAFAHQAEDEGGAGRSGGGDERSHLLLGPVSGFRRRDLRVPPALRDPGRVGPPVERHALRPPTRRCHSRDPRGMPGRPEVPDRRAGGGDRPAAGQGSDRRGRGACPLRRGLGTGPSLEHAAGPGASVRRKGRGRRRKDTRCHGRRGEEGAGMTAVAG